MLTLYYDSQGEKFSDFEIRNFFENNQLLLDYIGNQESIHISNGHFIRLIQICIAKQLIDFNQISLVIDKETLTFSKNGQIKDNIPDVNFSDIAYIMSKEFLKVMSNI